MNATAGTDSSSDGLRVALVTAYPPSQTTLNEYGYHLARHLAAKPEVRELVVMHDDFDGVEEPVADLPEGARAVPAWRYGSPWNPVRIVRAVRAAKADVVLVNAHFTSFGAGKIAAALGLLTPALLRASGTPTVVLLHNLVDTVDLEAAGFSSNPVITRILSFIGGVVTRMVLAADKVCVTMPQYVDVLRDKYGAKQRLPCPARELRGAGSRRTGKRRNAFAAGLRQVGHLQEGRGPPRCPRDPALRGDRRRGRRCRYR